MPLHIDHISLASPHIFRSADTLAKETGLGYWTGEWLRETSVNIVPLGPPGNFIEISGIIDIFSLRKMNERRQWILDITETGRSLQWPLPRRGFDGGARDLCQTLEERRSTGPTTRILDALPARQRLHPADGVDAGDQALGVDARAAQRLLLPGSHAGTRAANRRTRFPTRCAPPVSSGWRSAARRSRWRTGWAACSSSTCCR